MKHQLTRKRIVSILLAVCMLVSMLSVGMAGALDVSADSPYAEINDGNAYYRYLIPALYPRQWYEMTNAELVAKYQSLWNATEGHSSNNAGRLHNLTGGVCTHYVASVDADGATHYDLKTDPVIVFPKALNGADVAFGKYYGAVAPSIQMLIRVPSSDTYTVKANFYYGLAAQDDAVDFWIAPEDAADPVAEDYYFAQLSGIQNGGVAALTKYGEVGEIDLEAGEYIVTMKGANGKNLYGGNLELFGSMAPTVVDLTVDDTALNADGYLEVPAGDEDGVWVSIFAEDRDFGELDLIEYDAPSYARVDEFSDMITASYEDGMVNVKASHINEKDTTSATLYLEVAGAAAWVEIPVKVVPGANDILTLGHTGATDKIMANVGEYPITLDAKINGVATEITADDIVEVEIVDADGNVTENVTATVDGANISFAGTVGGSYTAKVTATVAGVELAAAYEIPLTVTNFGLYFNFMKMGANGVVATANSSYWAIKDFINSYADTWTGGSTDINTAVKSDGWKPGAKSAACGDWWWTSSAQLYGAYFAFNAAGEWNSADIYVPVSGNYTITSDHTAWATGTNVNYYLAPVGTANPIQDQYKLNAEPINQKNAAIGADPKVLGTVDVEAGEYMIVLEAVGAAGGVFIKGVEFSLNGEATGSKVWIDESYKFINYSLSYPTNWTWQPKCLPAFLADSVKFTWSSSNNNVSQVNPNSSISHKHDGYAEMTMTGTDGSTYTVPFVVGAADIEYKFLDAAVSAYKKTGGNADLSKYSEFINNGYAGAEDAGFGAWFVKDSTSNYANAYFEGTTIYLGCYWATSEKLNGMTTGLGGADAYTQFQIRVDADGEYAIVSDIDYNSIGWSPHSIYLAPVDAENPTADEFKLIDIDGTRAANGGKAMTTTMLGVKDVEAGEYLLTYKKSAASANRSTAANTINNIDYLNVANVRFYQIDKAPEVALDTVDGAQIRTSGKQGLRFISSFAKSGDWAAIKEVGTVLIPTADLTADTDLVIGYSANGHDALVVPAVKYYTENDLKIEYTAVITDIAAANYGRAISARSYAIVEDVYGNEYTIYGDAVTSRSVLQVAQNGLLDPNASEEDKAIFQEIVDAANA